MVKMPHDPLKDIYVVPAFPALSPKCSVCHMKGIQLLSGNWPELALLSEV